MNYVTDHDPNHLQKLHSYALLIHYRPHDMELTQTEITP